MREETGESLADIRRNHRDECPGIIDCDEHPVPIVEIDGPVISHTGCFYIRRGKSFARVGHYHELGEAVDEARTLAVGE